MTGLRAKVAAFGVAALAVLAGCSSHSERMLPVRTALDTGHPREAIAKLNDELDVKSDADLPSDLGGDASLLVLDRASIQQSLAQWKLSETDFGAADKSIDMLDLAHNAGDTIGNYVFSGSSGRYVAPPYEKLLINTLNMVNYLETKDLVGAKVEARRLSVLLRYYKDQLKEPNNAVLGLAGFLAGLAYEKSGDADEALRYYDEALQFAGFDALAGTVARLTRLSSYSSPKLKEAAARGASEPPIGPDEGEIVFVLGYGRVPHKIANRVPIGLALTYVSSAMSPHDLEAANKLAAQGLVTWINYPTLAPEQRLYSVPTCTVDGSAVKLEEAVNVASQVREEWRKVEGQVILSAITRLVARLALGQGVQAASGRDSIVGFLASLGLQASLSALDTPDTRSWETLPARVAIARMRVPAGSHKLVLEARGVRRAYALDVPRGGWALASLMALR